ncbi:MAG TPA: acyl-CoA dehydrogenase family protein [Acidimicrobiia bacterium]|jgi:alkylation response protein AidB-like acyl-CoA dehydrogenase|nr:acyl-CoA dehydrogenase family protein [Acidimicrobiia bacterium]
MSDADYPRVDALVDELIAECPPGKTDDIEFWGAQYDKGLAWAWHPEGFGGLGLERRHQTRVNRRLEEAGASIENRYTNLLGIAMGAGVLDAHATDEQKRRWLRPMFTTEEIWCQLFSEPGAGSDVAGLATRAVRDGDEWVVNGQKVWTTLAHLAKWGMVVTRTDPNAPKHQGLTYFVIDMEAPGVEVRPLYQITGEAEFNEVFFNDVRIPDENRIDAVGAGWRVAVTTLMNERVAIGGSAIPRESGYIGQAVEVWRETGEDDLVLRDRLLELWAEAEAARLTALRANELASAGIPGPEGSTGKLAWANLNKEITAFTVELLGLDGTLYPGGYELRRPERIAQHEPHKAFLRTRANSIEGGTSEIMLNILGERVLGLPGEPRVDKDVPWVEVPRG